MLFARERVVKNLKCGDEFMKIEHIAMYVNDLERAKEFFIKYFNATSNDGYYESCIVGIEGNQIEITE